MSNLSILSTEIRQHDGLFSLNDLHKASGGEKKHRPNYFLAIEQTKELIAEIGKAEISAIKAKQGLGTFGCKEIVIAYGAWISPTIHLAVIRAFLNQQEQQLLQSQTITPAQQNALQQLVAEKSGKDGSKRAYYWSRFNNHFKLGSYKQLPQSQFDEGVSYLDSLPSIAGQLPSPAPLQLNYPERALVTIRDGQITSVEDVADYNLVNTQGVNVIRKNLALISEQLRWLDGEVSNSVLEQPLISTKDRSK